MATTDLPPIPRRALFAQAAAVLLLGAAAAAWMAHVHARPLDAGTLALPVGDLASHGAELAALSRLGVHREMPADVAAHHAAQLADAVDTTRREFDRPVAATLAAARDDARSLAARLSRDAAALAHAPTDRGVMHRLEADAAATRALDDTMSAGAR